MTQRLNYTTIAPVGVKALGGVRAYITQSDLSVQLVELVYLRISQINGCAYCIDLHSGDLLKGGLAVEKLVLIPAWREAGSLFDSRERAARPAACYSGSWETGSDARKCCYTL